MKKKRLQAEIGFVLTGILFPLILFTIRFELFSRYTKANTPLKIGLIGFFVIIIFLISLYRFTKFRIKNLEHGFLKISLYALAGIIASYISVLFVWVASNYIEALWFIVTWIAFFETISFGIFLPMILHYDFYIKKERRKQEMIEAIREA
jgi:hypothetical protein